MSIVAVSDTVGSLGTEIGRKVAAILGYEFANREIISKAAERFGEGVVELTHATEEKPTLWERLTDTQRRYTTYVEAIMLEMAARDSVVLVGRASTVILKSVPYARCGSASALPSACARNGSNSTWGSLTPQRSTTCGRPIASVPRV